MFWRVKICKGWVWLSEAATSEFIIAQASYPVVTAYMFTWDNFCQPVDAAEFISVCMYIIDAVTAIISRIAYQYVCLLLSLFCKLLLSFLHFPNMMMMAWFPS